MKWRRNVIEQKKKSGKEVAIFNSIFLALTHWLTTTVSLHKCMCGLCGGGEVLGAKENCFLPTTTTIHGHCSSTSESHPPISGFPNFIPLGTVALDRVANNGTLKLIKRSYRDYPLFRTTWKVVGDRESGGGERESLTLLVEWLYSRAHPFPPLSLQLWFKRKTIMEGVFPCLFSSWRWLLLNVSPLDDLHKREFTCLSWLCFSCRVCWTKWKRERPQPCTVIVEDRVETGWS